MSRIAKTVASVAARLAAIFSFVLFQVRYSRADDVIPEYARGTPVPEAQFCPTSPDVRAMIRYGNGTSVNMYNGAATYTINLYTYRDRDFSIPVSISYRGDGFRPGRAPGIVGTGWYLNAGGVITREIRGLPDEATSYTYASKTEGDCSIDDVFTIAAASGLDHGVLKRMLYDYNRSRCVNVFGFGARKFSSGQMKSADYAYSGEIGREYVLFQEEIASSSARKFETESDLYHFSFMGYSGSFVLGDDGECIVLNSDSPAGEIQITYNYDRYSPLRTTFTITTGDRYQTTHGIFTSQDPLAEQSYSVSPYAYCNDNPVNMVDYSGKKVIPHGLAELEVIRNTLPENARRYVQLDGNGMIDNELLSQYPGKSLNFRSLIELINTDKIIYFRIDNKFSYKGPNGQLGTLYLSYFPADEPFPEGKDLNFEFTSGLSTGESGFYGKTLFPDNKGKQNSSTDNIEIIIHPALSRIGAAEAFSHEGYGHALLYIRNGGDHDGASHITKGMVETNIVLKIMILNARRETFNNLMK